MAARGRPKANKPSQATKLLEALDFVSHATGDLEDWQQFVTFANKSVIAFNGQIAAGFPVAEEINLCPQLDRLRSALKRCGNSLVINETPANQLSIKGEKIRALVPCLTKADLPFMGPNEQVAIIDDRLKEAFKVCASISSEAAATVVEASLLLEANTCTSVGHIKATILQYWHGIDLPPDIVIPKVFADAVVKQSQKLTGFGFSYQGNDVGSVTFWFENGAWLKTQCYQDRWPDIRTIVDVPSYPSEVIGGLFEAAEAVMNFSDDGLVFFGQDKLMSHNADNVGAQYDVKGVQAGKAFTGKYLKAIAPLVKTMDLTTYPDKAFFFGGEDANPIRGVIACLKEPVREIEPEQPPANQGWGQPQPESQVNYEVCPVCNDEGDGCEACT